MLRRFTPLRRVSFRRTTHKSKYRRRIRHLDFMLFVKRLACSARGLDPSSPCCGEVEADHVGPRGIGMKCDDRLCIPLCQKHHRERQGFSGAFKAFEQKDMRLWIARQLVATQTAAIKCGVVTVPAD